MIANILMGRYNFLHDAWDAISEDAIFFIKACLSPTTCIATVSRRYRTPGCWRTRITSQGSTDRRRATATLPVKASASPRPEISPSAAEQRVQRPLTAEYHAWGGVPDPLKKLRPLRDLSR